MSKTGLLLLARLRRWHKFLCSDVTKLGFLNPGQIFTEGKKLVIAEKKANPNSFKKAVNTLFITPFFLDFLLEASLSNIYLIILSSEIGKMLHWDPM